MNIAMRIRKGKRLLKNEELSNSGLVKMVYTTS